MASGIVKTLFIAFFVACCISYCENMLACNGAGILNKICQVRFNHSKCSNDNNQKAKLDKNFQTCYNKTVYDENGNRRNMSQSRATFSCRAKCIHQFYGQLNSDGKYNFENIESTIKQEHKLYSNATNAFVQKVVSIVNQCAKRAEQMVEEKSDKQDKCWRHGFLETCYHDKIMYILRNGNATEELCAAQGTKVRAVNFEVGLFKTYSSTATPHKRQ